MALVDISPEEIGARNNKTYEGLKSKAGLTAGESLSRNNKTYEGLKF